MNDLKVYTIPELLLNKHRLEKKMAYSEREKYYKPEKSFDEIIRNLSEKS